MVASGKELRAVDEQFRELPMFVREKRQLRRRTTTRQLRWARVPSRQ